MGASATITVKSKAPVVLPRSAVFTESGREYVFVVRKGHAVKTKVVIGLTGKSNIWILAGVMPGEDYIVSGTESLLDGDAVTVSK